MLTLFVHTHFLIRKCSTRSVCLTAKEAMISTVMDSGDLRNFLCAYVFQIGTICVYNAFYVIGMQIQSKSSQICLDFGTKNCI